MISAAAGLADKGGNQPADSVGLISESALFQYGYFYR
jgi:hypothetical protein